MDLQQAVCQGMMPDQGFRQEALRFISAVA
jgi:hypothetical protein